MESPPIKRHLKTVPIVRCVTDPEIKDIKEGSWLIGFEKNITIAAEFNVGELTVLAQLA